MPGEIDEQKELKEFLSRNEVRTMQKDLAKLREQEAGTEKERIAALKIEEDGKIAAEKENKAEEKKTLPQAPAETAAAFIPPFAEKPVIGEDKTTLISKPPKRPPSFQKVLVRAIMALAVFFLVSFSFWFLVIKKGELSPETTPPAGDILPQEEDIVIPESLIAVKETKTLEVSKLEDVPASLTQALAEKIETEGFTRILIEDTQNNKILGLKEFLAAFETKTPEGFLDKFNNDFTLFVYSGTNTDRLGFVVKMEEAEGVSDLLTTWEETVENDTETLFSALGKTGPALAPLFKQTAFNDTPFRFLTISRDDFGICYALVNNYFVFTTSFESMKKTIEELKKIEETIGQLFIIGFNGKTITPEFEKIFKKYRPGGVILLSKNIGNPEQLKKLTKDLQELSVKETGLPLFIAVDQEGGIISRVGFASEKTPQSEIDSPQEAEQIGLIRSEELKGLGINLNLSPVLDNVQETDFLFSRSFQKTPEESSLLAKFLIKAQGIAGVLAAIKHFPGYGGISFNPESSLAEVDNLPEISQFKLAMETNPEFVMTSNVIYKSLDPNLPFTFSPAAIKFLKDNLGRDILIISDDLAQNYLLEKFTLKDVVLMPLEAGVDVLIFSGWQIDPAKGLDVFYDAFRKGEITRAEISEKISKIIQLKQKLTI